MYCEKNLFPFLHERLTKFLLVGKRPLNRSGLCIPCSISGLFNLVTTFDHNRDYDFVNISTKNSVVHYASIASFSIILKEFHPFENYIFTKLLHKEVRR